MRKLALVTGVVWMAALAAFGIWLGFAEAFLHAPGLVFASGWGDVWILGIAGIPGYALWQWGRRLTTAR